VARDNYARRQGPGRSTLHHRISAIYNKPIKAQQQPGRTRLRSSAGCRQRIIHYPARLSGASIGFLSGGRDVPRWRTYVRAHEPVFWCGTAWLQSGGGQAKPTRAPLGRRRRVHQNNIYISLPELRRAPDSLGASIYHLRARLYLRRMILHTCLRQDPAVCSRLQPA
jgi:hypothetical protein